MLQRLCDNLEVFICRTELAASTYRGYRSFLNKHPEPKIGKTELKEIQRKDVKESWTGPIRAKDGPNQKRVYGKNRKPLIS
ncbi:hypothetical protein [Desulfonema ishimotonii]|uniref:hypothetical protein n=1 Tax=Desulfonema ishimotonii TaxID=45657 RepID=UPI000F55DEB9